MAFFTVIIPTYNRAHTISKTILSVLNQTYTDFEIIVVDDGSTDNTEELICGIEDPRIIYCYQNNSGVSSARNTGVDIAKGEFIAYLDSDDQWDKNKLEVIHSVINEFNVDVLFTDFDRYSLISGRKKPSNSFFFGKPEGARQNKEVILFSRREIQELIVCGYPVYPSTLVVKRIVQKDFRWNIDKLRSEDFNFIIQLIDHCNFAYVDKILTTIFEHGSNKSSNVLGKSIVHLSSLICYKENHDKNDEIYNLIERKIADEYIRLLGLYLEDNSYSQMVGVFFRLVFSRGLYIKLLDKLGRHVKK